MLRAWAPPLAVAILVAVACVVVFSTISEHDAVLQEAVETASPINNNRDELFMSLAQKEEEKGLSSEDAV